MASSYSGNPATSAKDAVRFWVQDTAAPWKLQDEEIAYVLGMFPNPMRCAAHCARSISGKYALQADKSVGDLRISYSQRSTAYADLADRLQAQADTLGVTPYSGGTSVADKQVVNANTDRPTPPFRDKQFDNPNGVNNSSQSAWDQDTWGSGAP